MQSATTEPPRPDAARPACEPAGLVGPDRPTRFLARIDAHLTALGPRQKLSFLDIQLKAWTRAYARFICTEGASEPTMTADDPPHCSDYLLTIAGLATRRCDAVDQIEAVQRQVGRG